jgi:hypothetical protein
MALPETGLDFLGEDFDKAHKFFEGCWVIGNKHAAGLNRALEVNNRTFVFQLKDKSGADTLLAFGPGRQPVIDAVKTIESDTGLKLGWVIGNGGGHHMFLSLWYDAFPEARVLVPAKRVPDTRNGLELAERYKDRWELLEGPRCEVLAEEFGDQIDTAVFDQLFTYPDQEAAKFGAAKDHSSEEVHLGGFKLMKFFGALTKNVSQPNDEVFLFHKASGLVIAGHNFQFIYKPKGYKAPTKHKLNGGGFPLSIMFNMMMPAGSFKSALEGQPGPIADPEVHASTWSAVLDWDIKAWTSCHDVPTVCGPDVDGDGIKELVRASLARSGEDDPTGGRLKWTKKHGRHTP